MSQPRASTSASTPLWPTGELSAAAAGGAAVAPPPSSSASTSSRKNDEALTRATGTSDSWAMESSIDLCRRASSGRRGDRNSASHLASSACERAPREPRARAHSAHSFLAVAASFLLSRRHICDVARSWYQHGGRVHRPRQGRQAQRRRRLRVHGRLAVPGRLEAGPQERPRHALVCQRCARPPPQFRRRRRRLTSPRAAPQATNSRASGRMGGCTASACTPGKLATSTSAR